MYTLKHGTLTYEVDHAVKGHNYVHGYDADGVCVIAFDGVTDFSKISYNGEYMDPSTCAEEPCNDVKLCNNKLIVRSGAVVNGELYATIPVSSWGLTPQDEHNPNTYVADFVVDGVKYGDTLFIDVDLRTTGAASEATPRIEAFNHIGRVIVLTSNTIRVTCYNGAPAIDLPLFIKVVR